jgi:hypothetical protein
MILVADYELCHFFSKNTVKFKVLRTHPLNPPLYFGLRHSYRGGLSTRCFFAG